MFLKKSRMFIITVIAIFISMCTACQEANVIETSESTIEITEKLQNQVQETEPLDWISDGEEYIISELGIDLEIPASLFVYRIDGLYLDDRQRIISLDFVDWVIVTDKEYSEEYLKNELIDHIHEEIKHFVFGVELPVEDELFPVCRLFTSYLAGTRRVTENGYMKLLDVDRRAVGVGAYARVDQEAEDTLVSLAEGWKEKIKECSEPEYTLDMFGDSRHMLAPYPVASDPYLLTMLNETWWKAYKDALEELTVDPSRHHYDSQTISSLMGAVEEHVELYKKMSVVTENDGEIVSTYADETVDACLRAYFYANEVAMSEANGKDTTALSTDDVIVILQDWDNGQKTCYGYVKSDGTGEYESVYRGGQAYMMDLTAAYQYIEAIAGKGE